MKRLSGLDALFLHLETPEMPMHVGALHVLELPPGFKGRFVVRLRQHIASRLAAAPVLRQKLSWPPLKLTNPAWVAAEPDLKAHIVEVKLPPGSDLVTVQDKVAELHPQLLDRERPLWKFHVIEGLAKGENGRRRVALYTQVHHAAVDGQAAVALGAAIFDLEPTPPAAPAKSRRRSASLPIGWSQWLRQAMSGEAGQWAQLVKDLPASLSAVTTAATQSLLRSVQRFTSGGQGGWSLAPRTRLNGSVSSRRAFAAVSLPIAELKSLAKAHQASLNDIVLMLCSTALRRHFARHGPMPRKSLVAAVPVSLRAQGDTRSDNQASIALVAIGTEIADPVQRLAQIKAATASMKQTMSQLKQVLPTDFPSLGLPWLMPMLAGVYGRAKVAERLPAFASVAISNVPGPPVPLYLAGARMLANYPTSIVVHGVGLNITVQSYDRSLDVGLMACAEALPEVHELAEGIALALDELRALPLPESAATSRGALARLGASMLGAVSKATRAPRASARVRTVGRR